MKHGHKSPERTEAIDLDEKLGYTHTYSLPKELDLTSASARPKYRPEFRELSRDKLAKRDYLR